LRFQALMEPMLDDSTDSTDEVPAHPTVGEGVPIQHSGCLTVETGEE
jgi:hypothetical protein